MALRAVPCGLTALALAAPAGAGSIVPRLGLVPGTLAVRAAPASLQAGRSASLHVTVADGRGSGAGWVLSLKSGAPVTVTAVTAACGRRSTCTLPRSGAPSGATVLRAARGTGMGVIDLVVNVRARADALVAFTIR